MPAARQREGRLTGRGRGAAPRSDAAARAVVPRPWRSHQSPDGHRPRPQPLRETTRARCSGSIASQVRRRARRVRFRSPSQLGDKLVRQSEDRSDRIRVLCFRKGHSHRGGGPAERASALPAGELTPAP